jgi:hypothetical protein
MQIAAEHAERQSVGTGQHVEERFFLGRIAGERGDVIRGHAQVPAFVESNLADAALAQI